jgi:hypothetical protein
LEDIRRIPVKIFIINQKIKGKDSEFVKIGIYLKERIKEIESAFQKFFTRTFNVFDFSLSYLQIMIGR